VAIAITNGLEYIRCALDRGLSIESFAHSVYMFLSSGLDIFEEVAKFRATRRVWADILRERFGVTDEASRALNIFCYTLGGHQTAAEPLKQPGSDLLPSAGSGARWCADPRFRRSFDEALGIPSPVAAHLVFALSRSWHSRPGSLDRPILLGARTSSRP